VNWNERINSCPHVLLCVCRLRPDVVSGWLKPPTELRQLPTDFGFSLVNEALEGYNELPSLIRTTVQTLSGNE
jgi:hypothetical protein